VAYYEVFDASGSGTPVAQGNLSQGGTNVTLGQQQGDNDSYTAKAGTMVNGTFDSTETIQLMALVTTASDVTINKTAGETTGVSHVKPGDRESHNYKIVSVTPAGPGAVAGDIAGLADGDSVVLGGLGNTDVTFTYKGGAVAAGARTYTVKIEASGDSDIKATLTITVK